MWLEQLKKWQEQGVACAIVTIIESKGSTPRKTGAKMVVNHKGEIAGSVGGGTAEKQSIELALEAIRDGACITQRFVSHTEGAQWVADDKPLGACGGSLTVFIEPMLPEAEMVFFGGGHIGGYLAKLCAAIDMPYRVYDDRAEILKPENFPGAKALIHGPFDAIDKHIKLSSSSYCVIMTYGHDHDETVLEQLLHNEAPPYLGMVGSPHKAHVLIENISGRGTKIDERVYCPVGLKIGRNLPQEIALSILSEVILLMHGGKLQHLRRNWNSDFVRINN